MAANDDIYDGILRHQIGIQRLASGEVSEILALLAAGEKDVLSKLRDHAGTELGKRRLEQMLRDIRDITAKTYASVGRKLERDLVDLADYEADYQKRLIDRALPINFNVTRPTLNQLRSAVLSKPLQGRYLKEWTDALEVGSYGRVRDAVRVGWLEGEPIDAIVRRVSGTAAMKYRDGVQEVSRRSATAMVRTAVNDVSNHSRDLLYRQNSDLIDKWRFVATLDGRTTLICMSLDGETYPVGEGPMPPRHVGCRSTSAPITKSWRDLGIDIDEIEPGTRASMNGQVPEKETYQTWLKRQPTEFQDDVLGPSRGKMFRDGGLTLDKFVDESGRTYTLAELRRREA